MAVEVGRISSGVTDLDEAIGGLIPGDNIIWVADSNSAFPLFESAFLSEGLRRGRTCAYVQTNETELDVSGLDSAIIRFDARAGRAQSDAAALEEALVGIGRAHSDAHVVVGGLDTLVRRWGVERVVAFYRRTCPRLFDLGALAYWRVSRQAMGSSSLDQVRHVAQCVLEIGDAQLDVLKAEGRPAAVQGRIFQMEVQDGVPMLSSERALGRIGRGLHRLRQQRNLSQADLAGYAGVTPSAISQAESGRRGLSLDTLLVLGERLGMGIDELLDNRPATGYVLARRPATPGSVAPLLDDPEQGLLVYLVRLGPGAEGSPSFSFKGIELIAVAAGLIQLTVGPETPVMRAGDAVLTARDPVRGWRNLINEPALFFWILKA